MKVAHPSSAIVTNAAKLATAFRKENLPVVIVNVNPVGSPSTLVRTGRSMMPKDPAALEQALKVMTETGFFNIVPELNVQPTDILITKSTWNAFFKTSLHSELQKNKVTGIVLAGIATSIGVESTARSANEWGYNIVFAEDAMTDMVPEAHKNSLEIIFPRIGETGDTETILAWLSQRS
jgi:nicotinamidase-related amidase